MKLYTKQGDKGNTRLGNGSEVSKADLSMQAIGSLDELNALLGVVISQAKLNQALLEKIQHQLFNIGAELCLSKAKYDKIEKDIASLEWHIDHFQQNTKPLKNFILPGGKNDSAWLHYARTICRRAERDVVAYLNHLESQEAPCNKNIVIYLNRLSDFFFALARYQNNQGKDDVLWKQNES